MNSESSNPNHLPDDIYHEKQSRQLCAVHTLNNLFQEECFTKQQLDSICEKLAPGQLINPHRSFIGLGNYDVNVMMAAMQSKNMEIVWFDKRKDVSKLRLDQIRGFILNIASGIHLGFVHIPIQRKHWIAICQIAEVYYNLDSKLKDPHVIGDEQALISFLQEAMNCKEKEILIVVSPDVAQSEAWISKS